MVTITSLGSPGPQGSTPMSPLTLLALGEATCPRRLALGLRPSRRSKRGLPPPTVTLAFRTVRYPYVAAGAHETLRYTQMIVHLEGRIWGSYGLARSDHRRWNRLFANFGTRNETLRQGSAGRFSCRFPKLFRPVVTTFVHCIQNSSMNWL